MSGQLELHDLGALDDLQSALSSFQVAVDQGLAAAGAEIARAEAYLSEAIHRRRYRLEQAEQEVAACEAALAACENSGFYGPDGVYWPPDCSYEATALQEAYRALADCETQLQAAYAWQERFVYAESAYSRDANALAELVGEPVAQARAELASLARRYEAVHSGSLSDGSGRSAGATRAPASGAWVERGVRPVPLADLPPITEISGPGDFAKTSIDDMRAGIGRLQEMQGSIGSGAAASSDYWADYDRQRGLSYEGGYQRVYDAFYGQGAIRVEKDGDRYDVINGRHRIWLAQQMGISRLPMRVVERSKS